MKYRKYFACSVGQPGEGYDRENLDRIMKNKAFVLHEDTKMKGHYYEIEPGDIVILKYRNQFIAYGLVIERKQTKDKEWNLLATVPEWHFRDVNNIEIGVSSYGIQWNTYEGSGQMGTVKMLKEDFGFKKLKEIDATNTLYYQILNEQKTMKTLQERIELLKYKKQIVLQGPPGTGKTRLARLIAEELTQPSEVGNPTSIINNFLAEFNPDAESIKAERVVRQKLLSDFQTRFPIESLKDMTLDDYCAGKGDRNNFCWWIETGLKSLGKYAPGSARSYLIYWSKDDDEYKKHGRLVKDIVNDEEAMQKIAELLYKVVKSKNPTDALEYFGDSFILKVLNSYYPDEFFPINGRDSLDNALKLFGVSGVQLSKFEKNKILNEQFQQRKNRLISNVDAFEFMRFLFGNFNLKTGEDLDTNQVVVSKGEYQLVQFHPSYSYEDFVRGIVASAADKGIVYKTENRILADFASKAIDNPNANYVLIIDEMNRANLPAVLGELIYALEYRGEKVTSMYEYEKEREITLPPNLYIIGTMNTADRSVGHIDYAIRRRFAFVPVTPSDSVIDEVITDPAVRAQAKGLYQKVAAFFSPALLMGDFKQDDVQLGHSYFLAQTTAQLDLKLEYEIKPLLREYLKDGILKSVRNDNEEEQTEIDINNLKVE